MTRNTLGDLNNLLFAQLERLDNEEMTEVELQSEIQRSKAIASVSSQIIQNANTVLKAKQLYSEYPDMAKEKPRMLEG